MFEEMTYEKILQDMLNDVPDTMDKRQGSVIWDALAPAAIQLAQAYFLLSAYADMFSIDTATDEALDLLAANYGRPRKAAVAATRLVVSIGSIDIGSRWAINEVFYTITQLVSENNYYAVCEQAGEIGNLYSGELLKIEGNATGRANLSSIVISGSEKETNDSLRKRIKQYIIDPIQDANKAQYLQWATEYAGIGMAKVFPLWNGGNTLKIAITNSSYIPAESALVAKFQEYIDPNSSGLGNGKAPCGSKVTVTGGIAKTIAVSANVILNEGYTTAEGAAEALSEYFASITYLKNTVSYMRIGTILLDCPSISDISNMLVNSATADITLVGEEIPVLGNLNLVVVTT